MLYYQLFYRYIKEYYKDRNFLYYDFKIYGDIILNLKKYNVPYFLLKARNMLIEILNDKKASKEFKHYLKLKYNQLLK